MFEWSKELMQKIKNKQDLKLRDLITIERALRLIECNDIMLNENIGIPDNDSALFELQYKL